MSETNGKGDPTLPELRIPANTSGTIRSELYTLPFPFWASGNFRNDLKIVAPSDIEPVCNGPSVPGRNTTPGFGTPSFEINRPAWTDVLLRSRHTRDVILLAELSFSFPPSRLLPPGSRGVEEGCMSNTDANCWLTTPP